jgi:hypothetical protein
VVSASRLVFGGQLLTLCAGCIRLAQRQ